MEILELVKPSPWVDSENHEWVFRISSIINMLEQCFKEAHVSLILFEKEMAAKRDPDKILKGYFEERDRRLAIRRSFEQEFDLTLFENYEKLDKKVETFLKQEKINEGSIPQSMQAVIPFIYAKSFIYSLDTIEKLINVLSEQPLVPEGLKKIKMSMGRHFPDLIHVRDSSHHIEDLRDSSHCIEDRVIGQRRDIRIKLQSIDDGEIKSDGGVIVLGNLSDSSFGCALGSGRYGKVDVSWESLDIVRGIIQSVIDSFQWKGVSQNQSQT